MRRKPNLCILGCIAPLVLAALAPAQERAGFISKVSISSPTLNVAARDRIRIQYALDREALATVQIYDAEHRTRRVVAKEKPSLPGINTVAWDGLDDAGEPVPDEAYYFTISCTDPQGATVSYDPPTFSGGERIAFSIRDMRYDPAAGAVVYHLSKPARIQIRAGVREGPLLKTIADWAPRLPGRHAEPWDAKDASGLINVPALRNWNLIGRGYTLPENSVFVTGSPARADSVAAAPRSPTGPLPAVETLSSDPRAEALNRAALIESTLAQRTRPVDPHAWTPFGMNAAPRFQISLVGVPSAGTSQTVRSISAAAGSAAAPTVSGSVGIQVSLDDATRLRLQEQRFEIVAYVDYQLMGEQEQGYSPYTYVLDTTALPNGEHVITINVAGLQDQLSAESLRVNVNNPGAR
jgi:hypothetical protein